jgi:aminopeptidase N
LLLLACLPLQHTKPSPGQPDKGPVLIPVRMGLLAPDGTELPLKLRG